MASSNTERSEAGERTETTAGEVDLERTVTCPEGGIVATFVLSTEADERSWVRLEQPLPSALDTADIGFRKDAAPAEWAVEDGLVRGTGAVPADGSVEFVLGLKLSDESAPKPSFPDPELTPCDEPEGPERAATAGPLERETTDGHEDHTPATAATDGGTDTDAGEATGHGEEESGIIGNEDGELAESIREVVEEGSEDLSDGETTDAEPADGEMTDAEAGDRERAAEPDEGESPSEVPDGEGLEAAVAAVESELEAESDTEPTEAEPPELDLQSPDSGADADAPGTTDDESAAGGLGGDGETPADGTSDDERAADEDEGPVPEDVSLDGAEPEGPLPDIDIATTPGGSESPPGVSAAGTGLDGDRSDAGLGSLVDRIEQADEADRDRLREALDVGTDDSGRGSAEREGGADGHRPLDVRLRNVESRLSAFEAYEDALEGFIEDSGTVEEIGDRATEAAEAATELREEVAGLREEIQAAEEERETLREELRTATEERDALREEVADLREDIADVRGLRQQLLGALRTPEGAETPGAAVSGDD